MEVRQAAHVKVTAQRYQDTHAKLEGYSAPFYVTKGEVQTKNAHYLATCAQNVQLLLKAEE